MGSFSFDVRGITCLYQLPSVTSHTWDEGGRMSDPINVQGGRSIHSHLHRDHV